MDLRDEGNSKGDCDEKLSFCMPMPMPMLLCGNGRLRLPWGFLECCGDWFEPRDVA